MAPRWQDPMSNWMDEEVMFPPRAVQSYPWEQSQQSRLPMLMKGVSRMPQTQMGWGTRPEANMDAIIQGWQNERAPMSSSGTTSGFYSNPSASQSPVSAGSPKATQSLSSGDNLAQLIRIFRKMQEIQSEFGPGIGGSGGSSGSSGGSGGSSGESSYDSSRYYMPNLGYSVRPQHRGWYDQYTQEHGARPNEQYRGIVKDGQGILDPYEEARWDAAWGDQFARTYGRPPNEDEWKASYGHRQQLKYANSGPAGGPAWNVLG